jgi:hypothetical protein
LGAALPVATEPEVVVSSTSFFFSSFSYGCKVVDGTCTSWNSFVNNNLNSPFDTVQFVSMNADYAVAGRFVF